MFHIARHILKGKRINCEKIFCEGSRYLREGREGKTLPFDQRHSITSRYTQIYQRLHTSPILGGYSLLRNSHIRFFYSSSTLKDFYKILDVSENATQLEIKKQFHKLAKLYHPDSAKNNGDDEKFKEVSEAYNTLGDQTKRIRYDADRNLYKSQQEQRQRSYNTSSNQSSFYQNAQRNQERKQQYEEYDTYNPYNRSKQQSTQDDSRYKTQKDYQGFQNRDFESQQILINISTFTNVRIMKFI